ncbi:MAG: phosphoribosylglycinamide formyltransferase [Candidatus Fermentithermobacillus carboniphilus]|uniref:Phosphoribosylglycinamide formyltransferase n=1 Tax=Candidatus Fermentithermobacillus carboniphilus TaxID=3085328 RepID=A0AAT9LCL9_9FIRM|nr:MAG: phosphoribosylglycinamide formyltransferase [Candidatus Fermentithermobacillus carboniphilus]
MTSREALLSLGVLVSGRGTNLQAILDACEKGEIPARVKVVISNRPKALALERARAKGVPAFCVNPSSYGKWPECRSAYEKKLVEILRSYGVELLVLAGYDRLVGTDILEAFPMRVINIHPALLPSFPGLNAQKQAFDYGVKVAGATVFFVDPSVDGGPIILQEACKVEEDDTVETLSQRILEIEHRILPRAIALIAQGRVRVDGRKVRILSPTASE